MRAASSGRTLRSCRRYAAIVGTIAMAAARPQPSTKRSICRPDRGVGPIEHHRTVGRQHDVVGMEVEVEDRLRRPEARRHPALDEVPDGDRREPAVQLGPLVGVAPEPPGASLEVGQHRVAVQLLHDQIGA
jgi:hypothetical protein